jgi:hypothetical protein
MVWTKRPHIEEGYCGVPGAVTRRSSSRRGGGWASALLHLLALLLGMGLLL